MIRLPDPYNYDEDLKGKAPVRILSDKGIKDALEAGLIGTDPAFNPEKDRKRIQPATLDLALQEVDETAPITYMHGDRFNGHDLFGNRHTFLGRNVSTIKLTEMLLFGQFRHEGPKMIYPNMEARSSLRRLGCYIYHPGLCFTGPTQTQIEIGNFSCNDIHFKEGERVAQAFFAVYALEDRSWTFLHNEDRVPRTLEIGDRVRNLDMGVEVQNHHQMRLLQKEGYMNITPRIETSMGLLLVHASDTAYRMRKIDGGIDFSKRDSYSKEDLLERIDISGGYTVKPFEHIIIETVEQMELSPHVGIRFWDNLPNAAVNDRLRRKSYKHVAESWGKNIEMSRLTDGWVDPGYKGGFSRQPKWLTGRRVFPGAAIGFGQVFFFPNGVGNAYGSTELGSQYQGKNETKFAR